MCLRSHPCGYRIARGERAVVDLGLGGASVEVGRVNTYGREDGCRTDGNTFAIRGHVLKLHHSCWEAGPKGILFLSHSSVAALTQAFSNRTR